MIWVALVAFFGTVATGLTTWFVARRQASGKVETTEAASLWTESANIRQELRNEAKELRDRVTTLEKEVRDCHGQSFDLQRRLAQLERGGSV